MRNLTALAPLLLVLAASPTAAREGPPPGPHFSSPNVEHLAHIPLENDTARARVVGRYT